MRLLLTFIFIFTFLIVSQNRCMACFAVVVGKEASADGSVLFGHLEQNSGLRNMSYRYVPRMQHEPGTKIQLRRGGTWPQVEETYAFLWTNNHGVEFSDGYFNEWGVAVASDACRTREDSYEELVARGDITDGGIGFQLRRIIAQQATTAREGLDIAIELVNHFGYVASGRTYIIADSEEAWMLALVRGKHWIAQRVPDDAIVLLPNVHIIGPEAKLNENDHVLASDGLIDYAIERGWHDPNSGKPFSFRDAYNREPSEGSFMYEQGADPRQWFSHSLIHGQLIDLPVEEQLPFAIYPDRKYGVQDLADLLRSHGHIEGQEPLMSKSYELGMPEDASPHYEPGIGAICSGTVQELVIYQLRSWMPTAIGSVAWRTTAAPCGSVLVPWYAGINQTPAPYFKPWPVDVALDLNHQFNPPPGTFEYDPDNAFDVFNALENMIDLNYSRNIKYVREKWDPFEEQKFLMQEAIEEVALMLWEEDKKLAITFLTTYSNQQAMQALDKAKKMLNHLKTIHWAY